MSREPEQRKVALGMECCTVCGCSEGMHQDGSMCECPCCRCYENGSGKRKCKCKGACKCKDK